MKIESCIIGKCQGGEVYKVTLSDYVNNRYYKEKYYVFLVDNNEAFASYVSVYDPYKKCIVPTFIVNNKNLSKEGYDTANGKLEPKGFEKISSTSGDLVDEILSDSFGSFATEMTDVDAFLKANLEF